MADAPKTPERSLHLETGDVFVGVPDATKIPGTEEGVFLQRYTVYRLTEEGRDAPLEEVLTAVRAAEKQRIKGLVAAAIAAVQGDEKKLT